MKSETGQVGQRQRRTLFLSGLLASGLFLVVLAGCSGSGSSSSSGGTPPTTPSATTLGVFAGAFNTAYTLPPPASITYTDKQGQQQVVQGYPGQVFVLFTANTPVEQATQLITSLKGTVLAQIPRLGFYLVSIQPATTEAAFISALFSNALVENAFPNGEASQNISSYSNEWGQWNDDAPVLSENSIYQIPLNTPRGQAGSILIDHFDRPAGGDWLFGAPYSHGTLVAEASFQAFGNPYFRVNVTKNDSLSVVWALSHTIVSSWNINPEQPVLINMSLGPVVNDDKKSWHVWTEAYLKAIKNIGAIQGFEGTLDQVVLAYAIGNGSLTRPILDLSDEITKLQLAYPSIVSNNLIIVGASRTDGAAYSYIAPGGGKDVVTESGTLVIPVTTQTYRGTSFAAPRILAKAELLLARARTQPAPKLLSGSEVVKALKCASQKDPIVTVDNAMTCVLGSVQFSAASYTVGKTVGRTAITLTRSGDLNEALTVNYAIAPGTAVQGQDYSDASPTPGTVRFEAQQTTASIPISIVNNPANTSSRDATITLGAITGSGTLGPISVATLAVRSGPAMSIVAGTGSFGYSGDGGPATSAQISVSDLAIDATGNVYLSGGNRIRRVDAVTGIITTVAGNGEFPPLPCLSPITSISPRSLKVELPQSLIFSDPFCGILRLSGGAITPLSPTGSGSLFPDYALDSTGTFYMGSPLGSYVESFRFINGSYSGVSLVVGSYSGSCHPFVEGGAALGTCLSGAKVIALDTGGNLYIVEEPQRGSYAVRKVSLGTGTISTEAGGGTGSLSDLFVDNVAVPATSKRLTSIRGIDLDASGNIYVMADLIILKVDVKTGLMTKVLSCIPQGVGSSKDYCVDYGRTLKLDGAGNIYFVQDDNSGFGRIMKVTQ